MGVARLFRAGTPYNGVELAELDYEQSADTMYLAHLDHPPTKLLRYANDRWTFARITFGPTIASPTGVTAAASSPNTDAENDGASYFPQPVSYAVTALNDAGQESRASDKAGTQNDLTLKRNFNTISWSAVAGASSYRVYKAENTGALGYIGTTTELTFRDDNIGANLTDGPPVGDNPFVDAGDWPSTVSFFEQRLMWARTRNRPNAIFGSRSGAANFEVMDTSAPSKDSDALSFAIVAARVNAVNQMVPLTSLLALSSDAIFTVAGTGDGGVLTPSQINPRRQIGRGSSRLNPLVIDNVVFFKPSIGASIRAIGYSFEQDGFKSDDLTIYSPHLFEGFSIKSWAYAQEPNSLIWAVRSDGKLLCFTWEQEQQVWGWTLCETDGEVESVCSISERGEDRVYLTVWRTVGGVRRLYVERMVSARWDTIEETCFLDCATTFDFPEPTTVLPNLGHLEGRTLTALVDGSVVPDLVVTGGVVTLPVPGKLVSIGLPYAAAIETLPLALPFNGTNIAKTQQMGEAVVRVVNTRGLLVGATERTLNAIKPRSNEAYGAPNALRTGDYRAHPAPVVSNEVSLVLSMPDPLPATITAVLLDPIVSG